MRKRGSVLAAALAALAATSALAPALAADAPRASESDVLAALDATGTLGPGAAVASTLRAIAAFEGLDVPPAADCESLAGGLALHATRLGVAAPLPPLGVPPALDAALGCLLTAVHEANLAFDATWSGVPAADLAWLWQAGDAPDARALATLAGRDHGANLVAAIHAAERVERALPLLESIRAWPGPLPTLRVEPILSFESAGDTLYSQEFAVIVDLAGSDVYDNHAGGVFLAKTSPSSEFNAVQPGSSWEEQYVFLDGSYVYVAPSTQDADIVASAGLVIDLDGDDTYGVKRAPILSDLACGGEPRVAWVGTQGGGVAGVAMLFDLAGDNVFLGRTATQGAGHVMGVGVLVAGEGNDRFEGIRVAQGSAVLGGVGLLMDRGGDDAYRAAGPRGGVLNGDTRLCDDHARYNQGSAFDRRVGTAPPLLGILLDERGNDRYRSDAKAQGFAQGVGLGLLLDREGNDAYDAVDTSQGAAQGRPDADAIPTMACLGVLLDRAGDDAYAVIEKGQGWALARPLETPLPGADVNAVIGYAKNRDECVSVLADEAGLDAYSGMTGRGDGAFRAEGALGVFVDLG